jgi:hypothetical protein
VPASYAYYGNIDIAATSTLTLNSTVSPVFGVLAATSTVNYAASTADTVVATNYGNLTLTGSTKVFGAGSTSVAGNLVVNGVSNFNGVGSPFSTVNLFGNFTLTGGTTFSADSTGRFTLNMVGTSAQTMQGNGSTFQLFKLIVANPAGVVLASGTSNLTVGNPSGGGVELNSGNLTVGANTITTFSGLTYLTGSTTNSFTASPASNFVFNMAATATSAFGTIRFTPGTETINNLTINLLAPSYRGTLKLGTNCTVAGTLTLTNGTISTGAYTLAANGTVTRTNGRVFGLLQKPIGTGAVTKLFETGDTLQYAPVSVTFGNVTTAGTLTASTSVGKHPNLLTSGIDTSLTLKRYFTLTNSGIAFNNYSATFNFNAVDTVGAVNTANFVVKKFDLGTWSSPTVSSPLATSITVTGVTSFSDFAIGDQVAGGGTGTSTFAINGGWNLVSVPRTPANATPAVLFPGAVSGTVNSFLTGSYVSPTTMNVGEGYWAYYTAAGSNQITGTAVTTSSVTVATGNRWVLVGSVSASTPIAKLTSNPAGAIVSGTLNGFNGSAYFTPTTIDPGMGYWVFVSQPCTLTVSQ